MKMQVHLTVLRGLVNCLRVLLMQQVLGGTCAFHHMLTPKTTAPRPVNRAHYDQTDGQTDGQTGTRKFSV